MITLFGSGFAGFGWAKAHFAHPTISYPIARSTGDDSEMCVDKSHTPARGTRIEIYFSHAA
jgi:hypothetical protein